MPRRQGLLDKSGRLRAGEVIIGAAFGKMQHRVDLAGPQRDDQISRIRRCDGAVDDAHFGGDAVRGELSRKIGGAVFAGKIEQRPLGVGMAFGDQPHQIA